MKQFGLNVHSSHWVMIMIFMLVFIGCHGGEHRSVAQSAAEPVLISVNDSAYPEIIIEKGLEKAYDNAKWDLYIYSVIDTPRTYGGKYAFSGAQSYGAYPLLFDRMEQWGDTTIFMFNYYMNNDTLTDDKAQKQGVALVPESVFYTRTQEKISRCVHYKGVIEYEGNEILCIELKGDEGKVLPDSLTEEQQNAFRQRWGRLILPLNPIVKSYLRSNQHSLNPWLIREAKKRGVIYQN